MKFTGIETEAVDFARDFESTTLKSAVSAATTSGWAGAGGVTFSVMTFRRFGTAKTVDVTDGWR